MIPEGCKHTNATEAAGFTVCTKCGLVLDKVIDYGKEWHNYKEIRSSLERTAILKKDSVATFNKPYDLVGEQRSTFFRLRQKQLRLNQQINEWLDMCAEVAYQANLNPVVMKAADKIFPLIDVKNRKRKVMIAAVVYLCIKQLQIPKSLKELANDLDISENELRNGYTYVHSQLRRHNTRQDIKPIISRYTTDLDLDGRVFSLACKILQTRQNGEVNFTSKIYFHTSIII